MEEKREVLKQLLLLQKNAPRQLRIKNYIKGRGFSIGCLITPTGKKLKSVLVSKGKTNKCLKKYGKYLFDKRCLITHSISGWFTAIQVLMVIDIVYEHTKGKKALLIMDDYKAH